MRKALIALSIVVAVIILIVAGVVGYAVLNLNRIVQDNRDLILTRASAALGRKVGVEQIKASLGWGVMADLQGVTIADDPAFSSTPFVQAADVLAQVEFIPLLFRQIKITQLTLSNPAVRIMRNASGRLNISTIGAKQSATAGSLSAGAPTAGVPSGAASGALTGASPMASAPPAKSSSILNNIAISSFAIENGALTYQDGSAAPLEIKTLDLNVDNFGFSSPFDLKLSLAALGDQKNLDLSGKIGPILSNHGLDINEIPVALTASVGPLSLAAMRALPQLAKAIPPAIQVSDPINATLNASGTLGALELGVVTDLSPNHVVYGTIFDKAAGVTLKLDAAATRKDGAVAVNKADLTLNDLDLTATGVTIRNGRLGARLDTNRFDLGALAKQLVPLAKYNASGQAEAHVAVQTGQGNPQVHGTITLASVSGAIPGKPAFVSDISGDIRMAGNSAVVGPLNFKLGSGVASLSANAQSIQPLDATYQFSADTLKPGDFTGTASSDQLTKLSVAGTAKGSSSAPAVTAQVASPSGTLQNVAYQELAAVIAWSAPRLTVSSFRLSAFGGSLSGNAQAMVETVPSFSAALSCVSIDLKQALESQKSSAANIVRGQLTGQVNIAGRGKSFDQIKPTLSGDGKIAVANGKLKGINVVAETLRKVNGIPGIDTLVPAALVQSHPELFASPNTDLKALGMTFTLGNQRVTTHDLHAESADYTLLGDGWFGLDKTIDMAVRLILSPAFSNDLIAQRKNVVYLADSHGQVEIPVQVAGALPKPKVIPDVAKLAQTAAQQAMRKQGSRLLGGFLGKHLGGSGSSGGGNPLNQLKGLFH